MPGPIETMKVPTLTREEAVRANIDPQQAERYARSVLQRSEKKDPSLSKHEVRLARKYLETQNRMKKIASDIMEAKNLIEQTEAKRRSLELMFEQEQGKCNGYIDYMVDLKFIYEEEDQMGAPASTPAPMEAKPEEAKPMEEDASKKPNTKSTKPQDTAQPAA